MIAAEAPVVRSAPPERASDDSIRHHRDGNPPSKAQTQKKAATANWAWDKGKQAPRTLPPPAHPGARFSCQTLIEACGWLENTSSTTEDNRKRGILTWEGHPQPLASLVGSGTSGWAWEATLHAATRVSKLGASNGSSFNGPLANGRISASAGPLKPSIARRNGRKDVIRSVRLLSRPQGNYSISANGRCPMADFAIPAHITSVVLVLVLRLSTQTSRVG